MNYLFGGTDTGIVRDVNQDRYALRQVEDGLACAILCDGMGGENGGGVASQIATDHAVTVLNRDIRPGMSETTIRGVLSSVVSGANALVYEAAQKDASLSGMGTTMILAVLADRTLYAAYVGDSRVYAVSPGGERQLTTDHTVVQMLVDLGEITKNDALTHPKRHYITRAVGVSSAVEVDFLAEPLLEGEVALLCSDGLYNYLPSGGFFERLEPCLASGDVQSLIDLANQGGGSDNITAVVMG